MSAANAIRTHGAIPAFDAVILAEDISFDQREALASLRAWSRLSTAETLPCRCQQTRKSTQLLEASARKFLRHRRPIALCATAATLWWLTGSSPVARSARARLAGLFSASVIILREQGALSTDTRPQSAAA